MVCRHLWPAVTGGGGRFSGFFLFLADNRLTTLHGMDRAFVDARPAFVREGTDAAGMAQVFFLEGDDAEVAHDPVGAGIHIAGPYLHLRVQCDSKGLSPAFAVHGAKGFDNWIRIDSERAREGGLTAAFSPGYGHLADTPVYENG